MLPSFMQMLLSDSRRFRGPYGDRLGSLTAFAGAGYFIVWGVLGAAVYALGVSLATAEVRWPILARSVPGATGALLLLAGCIQLTAWKTRQLASCRESACAGALPGSARNAWEHGLRLGVRCALCCSSFMMVLLVVGVMNLRAMAFVTVAITVERFVPWPERAAPVAGVIVIAAGAIIVVRTLGIY
jgi:predicted metal-binding membrane protein